MVFGPKVEDFNEFGPNQFWSKIFGPKSISDPKRKPWSKPSLGQHQVRSKSTSGSEQNLGSNQVLNQARFLPKMNKIWTKTNSDTEVF